MKETILCIDDEAIILMSLKLELKKALSGNYDIETALNASQAITVLQELKTANASLSLVISDWLMPDSHDDHLLKQIHELFPGVKTILMSGLIGEKDIGEAVEHGLIDVILPKPWESDQLAQALQRLLGKPQETSRC